MLVPYRGLREIAHGGDISGFNSYVALYPTEKLAVVVLSNVGMRPPGPVPEAGAIAHEVVDVLAGDRLGPQWPPTVALAPEVLDRYVGRYRIDVPAPVVAVMGEAIEHPTRGASGSSRRASRARPRSSPSRRRSSTRRRARCGFASCPARRGAPVQAILTLMGLREFHLTRLP